MAHERGKSSGAARLDGLGEGCAADAWTLSARAGYE
jgi:hypothetical protein